MYIIFATISIIILSIGLSLWSLKNMQKGLRIKETKEELKKSRVVFHSSDVS